MFKIGKTSIAVKVEVCALRNKFDDDCIKVTEAILVIKQLMIMEILKRLPVLNKYVMVTKEILLIIKFQLSNKHIKILVLSKIIDFLNLPCIYGNKNLNSAT